MPTNSEVILGGTAPRTGTYALVHCSDRRHYGVAQWFRAGDRLPLAVAEDGPLGYELVAATTSTPETV